MKKTLAAALLAASLAAHAGAPIISDDEKTSMRVLDETVKMMEGRVAMGIVELKSSNNHISYMLMSAKNCGKSIGRYSMADPDDMQFDQEKFYYADGRRLVDGAMVELCAVAAARASAKPTASRKGSF